MMQASLLTWFVVLTGACAAKQKHELETMAGEMSSAIRRGERIGFESYVLPGYRAWVDGNSVLAPGSRDAWAADLRAAEATPGALLFLAPDRPVAAVRVLAGWRFDSDPSAYYGQRTPRQALASFVLATLNRRWDVVLELAPSRFRSGLAEADLASMWDASPRGDELRASRDRLRRNLHGVLHIDAHHAVLRSEGEAIARLEREGERWVVADF
ncbi:MAG: hypothetical protein V3V08_08660 [Nannocystaceae bacterium]